MKHFLRKLASTVRILACMGMARTFGKYEHTVWDHGLNYARYRWRDRTWAIPTSHLEEES
ncbi:hypothetical protein [Bradyrhizobium sp. sGM-13]|uniref:hypothetical protein n=1 Tax=Bradyrhizobium sp. sGM-13 TaxID=2831781 RepID=UPI001BD15099|nr:hypothetical protein [Bradyrhizobium sp. sGM-13]